MSAIVKKLDAIADNLETKGLLKEAHDLDVISNTIEAMDPYQFEPIQYSPYSKIQRAFGKRGDRSYYSSPNKSENISSWIELVSKHHPDFSKYEDEYLRMTDASSKNEFSSVPVVDIAKFFSRIKKDVDEILKREYANVDFSAQRGKDVTGRVVLAKKLRDFSGNLEDLINVCASYYRKKHQDGSTPSINIGSGPTKQDLEEQRKSEESSKGLEEKMKLPSYSLVAVKNYMKPSAGKVEVIDVENQGAESWYGHWEGYIIRLLSSGSVKMYTEYDDSADLLHGGYDVTGAHLKTGRRLMMELKSAGYDVSSKTISVADIPKLNNPSFKPQDSSRHSGGQKQEPEKVLVTENNDDWLN